MKKIILALLLLSPLTANAITVNAPSAAVSFAGTGVTLDVLPGADIAADGSGTSIGFSGFEHEINISGGNIQGNISFSGFDHVFNITGGSFGGDITGSGFDHIFNFTGTNLILSGLNVSGLLLDGSSIDLDIVGGFVRPVVNITNIGAVPVPAAIWLFGTALAGLVGFGNRRKGA